MGRLPCIRLDSGIALYIEAYKLSLTQPFSSSYVVFFSRPKSPAKSHSKSSGSWSSHQHLNFQAFNDNFIVIHSFILLYIFTTPDQVSLAIHISYIYKLLP